MSSLPPPPPPGSGPPPPPPSWNAPPAPGYQPPQPGYGTCWPEVGSFQYAGFWNRVGSRLLDSLILLGLVLPLAIPGIICLANGLDCYEVTSRRGGSTFECSGVKNGGLAAAGFALLFLGFIFLFVAQIRWWAKGTSPGRRAAGNRLVRAGTLQPIGYGRATGRMFASVLSGWVLYLGYFWMIWDKQKRTWHDMMCETIVIKA